MSDPDERANRELSKAHIPIRNAAVRAAYWADALPYVLVGCVVLAASGVVLFHWCTEQLDAGNYAGVGFVLAAALALVAGFIVATRGKRRLVAAVFVLAWAGMVVALLGGFGVRLPIF